MSQQREPTGDTPGTKAPRVSEVSGMALEQPPNENPDAKLDRLLCEHDSKIAAKRQSAEVEAARRRLNPQSSASEADATKPSGRIMSEMTTPATATTETPQV